MAVGSLILSLSPPATTSSSLPVGTRRTRRHHGNDSNIHKSTLHSPHGLQWRSRRHLSSPLLTNRPKLDNPVECNPHQEDEITDANVGVLGCSPDQICRASVDSPLGGFCYPSSSTSSSFVYTTRRLQVSQGVLDGCDPTSPFYQDYDCDCSNFDNTMKSGSISCRRPAKNLATRYFGCYDAFLTPTRTYSSINGTSAEYEDCYEIVAPTTSSSLCLQIMADLGTCEAQLDGQDCASCALSSQFISFGLSLNCSNVVGGDWGDPERANAGFLANLPIIQACYQPHNSTTAEYCDLCGGGDGDGSISANDTRTISLEGFGEAFPCYDLKLASWNFQIPADKCPEVAAVAQAECCFPPPPSSSTGTAAPTISSNSTPVDKTVAPGVGQDPPTAAPNTNSSTASATVPLCSSMMFVTGVLLLFSIIG